MHIDLIKFANFGPLYSYNNKIMIAAPESSPAIAQARLAAFSQYRKSPTPYQTISQESRSINIVVNHRHQRLDDNSEVKQAEAKLKTRNLSKSLFADNNFRCQTERISNESRSCFLQILRNLPRRTYQESNIKVLLKTEYSVIHNLVHKYFNFKFYNKEDQYNDIFLIWIDSYVSEEFVKRLKSYQRINHFPNSCELGRKDLLAFNLNAAKASMPELYQFYPKTWVLPRDFEAFNRREAEQFYIVKPHANCQGRGIYLAKNPNLTAKDEVIVQQYIQNPMLIDGCKFDLRIYVMVRSLDPLRIYVYQQGLCRLATSKYFKPNQNNFKNQKMHLTNYAINKLAPNFVGNCDFKEDYKGHKRSLTSAIKNLSEMGFDTIKILERIDSIIIRSILAAYTKMLQSYKKSRECSINFKHLREFISFKEEHKFFSSDNGGEQSVCFEVFGFDIMLLQTGEPILLEINHQPSLVTDSPLDLNIKRCLIMDTINILNFDESEKNLWQKSQSQSTPFKQRHSEQKQLERKGGYRRIYPLTHIKLHEKTEEEAIHIQKYIDSYEGMINKIMFREYKRLSKLKMINYKTITSRNNRTHISKNSNEDSDRTNTSVPKAPQKNSKSRNQKSVALTFYNLFSNCKYQITRGGLQKSTEKESESELEEAIIKNHIFLESIEKPNRISKQIENAERNSKKSNEELIDLKAKSRRQQFIRRKQEAFYSKLPQFKIEKEANNSEEFKLNEADKLSKMMRFNVLSSQNKGVIHYISTNKSKKALQQHKREIDTDFVPTFSTIGSKPVNTAQISQRSYNKSKDQQQNPQSNRTKTSERNRNESNEKVQYRQIYGNSIREKMEKINNLKIIKNNLHKLNFINFVERTKVVRNVIDNFKVDQQQKSTQMNKIN